MARGETTAGELARRRERPRSVLHSSEGAQRMARMLLRRVVLRSRLRPRMASWSDEEEQLTGDSITTASAKGDGGALPWRETTPAVMVGIRGCSSKPEEELEATAGGCDGGEYETLGEATKGRAGLVCIGDTVARCVKVTQDGRDVVSSTFSHPTSGASASYR